MSSFDYFVLATLSLVTLICVFKAIQLRTHLSKMASMMVSMAIGMNVGLTAGLLFGSFYQGNLYFSTIISILVGILAGSACGLVFGVLPSLEGFLAGLMGGMMGAMLGEMITADQADKIKNIFLTLSVCSLLLFPILHETHEKESKRKNSLWMVKPLFTFLVIVFYLILGNQLDKEAVQSKSIPSKDGQHDHSSQEDNDHSKHENSDLSKESTFQEISINVHPSNFSYDPKKIILEKGKEVRLTLMNHDSNDHDIEIKNFPVSIGTDEHHVDHSNNEADFHLHASPNKQSEMIFTPLKNGTFEFYCTIPGHKDSGMSGIIFVE
jgi:uncharacterized cupredoxin-like copper-binding protein